MTTYTPDDFGIGVLFNNIFNAVVVGEAGTGRIVLWNKPATTLLGYSADEAIGCSIEQVVAPQFRDQHREGIHRYATTRRSRLVDHEWVIVKARHKDGTVLDIQLRLMSLDGPGDGTYVGAIMSRGAEHSPAHPSQRRARRRWPLQHRPQ